MSDASDTKDKTTGGRRPLTLRRTVDSGTVRQNFSHGRSKAVVVEKRRRRVVAPKTDAAPTEEKAATPAPAAKPDPAPKPAAEAPAVETPSPAVEALKPQEASAAPPPPPPAAEAPPPPAETTAEASAPTAEKPEAAAPAKAAATAEKPASPPPAEDKPKAKSASPAPAAKSGAPRKRQGAVLRTLSESEKKARAAALAQAKAQQTERRKRDELEARERDQRAAEEAARLEAERQRAAEEEVRRAREAEERRVAEEEARKQLEAEDAARKNRRQKDGGSAAPAAAAAMQPDEVNPFKELGGRLKTKRPERFEDASKSAKPKSEARRRTGKLTIVNALDDEERTRSLASVRRAREKERQRAQSRNEPQKVVREVIVPEVITVQELAQRMSMRSVDLIKELMRQGHMMTANDSLDADTAQLIAEDLGHSVKRVAESDVEEGLLGDADEDAAMTSRPPVVTIMGHVDHGKTSLLDALRQTDVVKGEAGGITQHIGAYQVTLGKGDKITFLDTPGHAAFTQMRARGAKVTDLVVLVVSADDGVMPQTVEAISHAKAAEAPIIVAINKIDKPDADPNRVRTDLLQHEIITESMSGDVLDVEVSALQKTNLDKLQDAILLQSELLELKANPDRPADGAVVESKLDKGRGPVSTLLVQRGTLKVGDVFVAGSEWGKVRALIDDKGKQVKQAGPTLPVEVLGLNGVPEPGDQFVVVETEARAREIAEFRQRQRREKASAVSSRVSLEQMMSQLQDTDLKEFPLVVKGDVQGSIEAIVGALDKLSTDEVKARVLHSGVGAITESDIILAQASKAPVIGFNVRANKQARDEAERSGVEIRYYSVIYDLVDDVKAAMSGLLSPELRETFMGNAEILEIFNVSKVGKVAGCRVTEGSVRRGAKVRLIRDGVVIHEGELSTLKRFKDEVAEVQAGQECGMSFANYDDLKQGDVIECFDVESVERSL